MDKLTEFRESAIEMSEATIEDKYLEVEEYDYDQLIAKNKE